MDLSGRVDIAELMDGPDVEEAVYRRCLSDLSMINRVTFTHRATLAWLGRATKSLAPGAAFSVLDIAYGQGDLLRAIARWAGRRGFVVTLSGVDLNPRSAPAARAATPPDITNIAYLTSDVFDYMPADPVDFIVTSQFTHHLPDAEIVRLLRWMQAAAVRGWIVADLHRHPLAYHAFPLLARLFGWHKIVRLDGRASIARSFSRGDWERLCADAGVDARIKWRLPFRYTVNSLS
jgi:SAM-dependent methyltransferase